MFHGATTEIEHRALLVYYLRSMKFRLPSCLCLPALGFALVACRGPLPNEADLDRAYKHSQSLAQQDIAELDRRRAKGEISEGQYTVARQGILDKVTARANDVVLTQTALVQSRRQAMGLPTPESPQDISVPQAGTLATGTARRQFNDSGGADGTGAGLGFLPGGSIGITNLGIGGGAGPVTAVAQPIAPVTATNVVRAPAPSAGSPISSPVPAGNTGRGH